MTSKEKYNVELIDPAASSLQPFPNGDFGIPCNWSSDNHRSPTHRPYVLERLSEKCWEYTCIESEFQKAGAQVCSVHRIENKELWEKFNIENQRMLRTRTGVNEVYLLHGSTGKKDDICHEGLDQRLSRIGHFGRGIYFSNDARKCFSYTKNKKDDPDDGGIAVEEKKCTVYKCRVLLGIVKVYPKGQNAKHLKREPQLDKAGPGGLKYYDSVKGQVSDYEEYIVYKSERVLPEYIITCLPPSEAPSSSSTPQPAAINGLSDIATNGLQDSAMNGQKSAVERQSSPAHSAAPEGTDEEALELKYVSLESERQRSGSVNSTDSHGDNVEGAVGGTTRGERSGSVVGDDFQDEDVCDSAEEDAFYKSADEDVCDSAEDDVCESAGEEEDLSQSSQTQTKSNSASAFNGASMETTIQSPEASTPTSEPAAPMLRTEDEFQRHLLEVRKRVQEKRRLDAANPPPPCAVAPLTPYVAPKAATLDAEHQRRLEEVRRKVLEKRCKDKQKAASMATESQDDSSSSTVEAKEEEAPEEEVVNQVMSSLLAQFLEFTGCDDTEVASRYIRHAQMDVNNAIVMYLNTEQ